MQDQGDGAASHRFLALGGQGRSRDFLPHLESVLHFLTLGGCGKPMPTRMEILGDGPVGRKEPLGLTRRLEPLHTLLPLTSGLGGIVNLMAYVLK